VAGGLVLYAGMKNVTVSDALRGILKGTMPTGAPQVTKLSQALVPAAGPDVPTDSGSISTGGTVKPGPLGVQIVNAARQYLGRPYEFAAHGPNAFDCSGLVTYVLHHDLGLNLPSNVHTVTGLFYGWTGARTVGRPPAEGDLICWMGHIGIATGPTRMIHAPQPGQVVKEQDIWWTPEPLVRRVNGTPT
jgi:cell wall-associated NlpC family hydrolase